MRCNEQCPARSLVAPTRLDTDEAVLDNVRPSDRVSPADFVQQLNQRHRTHTHSIHTNRYSLLKLDLDFFLAVWRFLRGFRNLPRAVEGRVTRVFQLSALVADVPQIAVAAVNLLAAGRYRNAVRLSIIQTIFAGLQLPLAPRRDHV